MTAELYRVRFWKESWIMPPAPISVSTLERTVLGRVGF